MSPNTGKYLSFDELQEKLAGRSRSSIYRDLRNGRLPQPFKIGGRPLWSEAEVEEAIARLRSSQAAADKAHD